MHGEDLREIRGVLGFSQKQLGNALGVTNNTVSRWEIGASPVPEYIDLALETLEKRIKSKGWIEKNKQDEKFFCYYVWDEKEKSNVLVKVPYEQMQKEFQQKE